MKIRLIVAGLLVSVFLTAGGIVVSVIQNARTSRQDCAAVLLLSRLLFTPIEKAPGLEPGTDAQIDSLNRLYARQYRMVERFLAEEQDCSDALPPKTPPRPTYGALIDLGADGAQYGLLGFMLTAMLASVGLAIRLIVLGNKAFIEPAKATIERLEWENKACQRENRVMRRTIDGLIQVLQQQNIKVPSWVWTLPEKLEPPLDPPPVTSPQVEGRRRRSGRAYGDS